MELVLVWLGIAVVTAIAASARGRSAFGWFVLGLLFSLLALIAVLVMRPVDAEGDAAAPYDPMASRGPPRTGAIGGAGRGTLRVRGDGNFLQEVVGEARYRKEIRAAVGDPGPDGVDVRKIIVVEPHDTNPNDPNAVRVLIDGRTVGFLPREDAVEWRQALSRQGHSGFGLRVAARIRHGWERGPDDKGDFSIKLDAAYPYEFYRD